MVDMPKKISSFDVREFAAEYADKLKTAAETGVEDVERVLRQSALSLRQLVRRDAAQLNQAGAETARKAIDGVKAHPVMVGSAVAALFAIVALALTRRGPR